jgi:dCMP deaminase
MGSTAIAEAIRAPDNGRQSWDSYFMDLAESISTRATCERLKVGCIFTRDNRILSTGFNGALPKRRHCTEVGCLIHEGHCIRACHAEQNAVAQAAENGVSLKDSSLYVTHLCCINCYRLVLAAGCSHVYYHQSYGTAEMKYYYALQGMTRLEQIK